MSNRKRTPHLPTWPLDDAITVVLFAGMGGACAGLEEAGCPVHVANNHDDIALAAHAALHPHTRHIRGDIFDVDPLVATRGRRVKVLWASPDCTDHSVAKGGAPRSPRVRSLPWQVCRWGGKTQAEVIFMENVREIRGWGPLIAKRDRATGRVMKVDGTVAAVGERVPVQRQVLVRDKRRLGRSFRRWKKHMRSLGYAYEDRDLNCADFGVPTARRRFFAVMRRDGGLIKWPERTHAPAADAERLGLRPWVAAATILDWTIPLPSIFERKRPLADATMRRIAAGLTRYVLNNPRPFIVPLTHTGAIRVHDGAEPLPTLTTAHRGEFAVVAPHLKRAAEHPSEATWICEACGEVFVDKHANSDSGEGLSPPECPRCGDESQLRRRDGAVLAPVITGGGGRAAQVPPAEVMVPLGTSTTKGDRIVVGATMVQVGYGERAGQAPRALDIKAPIGTVVAAGNKHALVEAWLVQHNTGVVGHGADEPVGTISAGGNHIASVVAFLTKYYGQGSVAQGADEPLHTLSTLARFGIVTVQIEGEPYVVTDIGMRMLEPKEAAAAHELTLPEYITLDGERRKLTKSQAMRLVGNSVPKRMAYVLARANIRHALEQPVFADAAD